MTGVASPPRGVRSGPPYRRRLFAAASLALTVGAMVVIVRRTGVDAATALGHLPWQAHALALMAFFIGIAARGDRIVAVAQGLGIPLSFRDSIRAQLAGDAWGAVTPSRVGSDPAKMAVFHKAGIGLGQGGALLLAEMMAEAAVLLAAGVVIAALVPGGWWVALGVGGYAVAVSASGAAAYAATGWPAASPPAFWGALRLGASRWGAVRRATGDFRMHAGALRHLPIRSIARILAATVAHIAARLAILPALVLTLAAGGGATGSSVMDLILRPFFTLYATALLPPPGGGGGVEVVFATVLGSVLPPATLAAGLVWWRVYTFHLGALVGWLSLVAFRTSRHEILDTGRSHEAGTTFSGAKDEP